MRKLRQFEFVIEIARCGSISKAARYLNLAQPTLSKYLNNLEEEIGLELFDRTTIPIKLTEAGRRYLAAGERILKTYNKLGNDLNKIKEGMSDSVRIGMSPTRAHFILPELINNFKKINSEAKVVVEEYTVDELNEKLSRGELDLIISIKSEDTKYFNYVHLSDERTLLAIPSRYQKCDIKKVFKECPFISTGEGSYLYELLMNILFEYEMDEPIIEAKSIESVLALINNGMGMGLVPSYIKEHNQYENVCFIELPEEIKGNNNVENNRMVGVFCRQDKILNKLEEGFIEAAKKVY